MLDGATPAPLLLLLFWLIDNGEYFCLFHIDETCLKLYPCTIVHPTLPCKYVLLNLLFYHYLPVEGSQLFYIVLLIVGLVFLGVECFGLQELFEGWCCFDIHQIEHSFPLCLETKDEYSHYTRDTIV